MHAAIMSRHDKAILLALFCAALVIPATAAEPTGNSQIVDGVAIYFGTMPAEIVRGHPGTHVESQMHGGVPDEPGRVHLVVALFEAATGRRIEDGEVTAAMIGPGQGRESKDLERMRIVSTTTYGNYFTLSEFGSYRIELLVRIPGREPAIQANFVHQHVAR